LSSSRTTRPPKVMDAPSSARGSGEGIGRVRATSAVARGRAVRRRMEEQGEIPRHGATMTSREGSSRARARARSTSGAPPTACSRGMASPASRRPCLRARRAAGGRAALRRARSQHVASRRPYHQPLHIERPPPQGREGWRRVRFLPERAVGTAGLVRASLRRHTFTLQRFYLDSLALLSSSDAEHLPRLGSARIRRQAARHWATRASNPPTFAL
jgi:hypothetical protein